MKRPKVTTLSSVMRMDPLKNTCITYSEPDTLNEAVLWVDIQGHFFPLRI